MSKTKMLWAVLPAKYKVAVVAAAVLIAYYMLKKIGIVTLICKQYEQV